MKLSTPSFRGMAPRITPRALPENASQGATNAKLLTGNLRAWFRPGLVEQLGPCEPNIAIIAIPLSGPAPLTVQFGVSILGGHGPFAYAWEFGDGGTSTEAAPSHQYTTGNYTATVTVTTHCGTAVDSASISATPPLVYWKFNESAGATIGADSGTLGLPINLSPSLTTLGSTSLSTTGTSMLVSAGYNPATVLTDPALGFGAGDFTISAIIKTLDNGSIVGNGTTNIDWANWILFCTGGALQLRLADANSPLALTFFTGSSVINDNAVHRVAARRRGNTITLTDNGVDVASGTYSSALWTPTSSVGAACTPWTAGADPLDSSLAGNIANVAIWNVGLTDAQLAAHFASLTP